MRPCVYFQMQSIRLTHLFKITNARDSFK